MADRLPAFLFAQGTSLESLLIQHVASAVVFSVLGVIVFGLCFLVILKFTPFSIRKEIEEDQNIALAIIIGAMIIGLSMIIAAAVQG